MDETEDFLTRLDILHLLETREAGGLGSFLGGRVRLFPHHLHVAERATARMPVRWLLADEVGLGKTIEAALIMNRLLHTQKIERCLVVAPEALTVQWRGGAITEALREVIRHRLILATSATQAAQYIQHGALSAFLPLFAQARLGLSASQLGWLFAIQIGTTLLVRPLVGTLSDRVGRRPLIAIGVLISSAGLLAVSLAGSALVLAASIAGYALGVAITTGTSSAYITDLSHRARYGTSHGLFGSIYDIGDATGPLLGGVLAAALGYEAMFRIIAVCGILAAGVFVHSSRRDRN